MNWRDFHEATKHTTESLRRSAHSLDWANMPDPFRHYEGAPVLDLPADPPAPLASSTLPQSGAGFLSQLLYYSAAISAAKRVPSTGHKYALRVNPSSGNLHPTEFHFITNGLKDWPNGLYHYRASAHMAEQRARGNFDAQMGRPGSPLLFLLTTAAWREEWKYRDRAYRYCLHDLGHAWQSLALAARAMGCETSALGQFADERIVRVCRLPSDEWPMLMVEVRGHSTTMPLALPDATGTTTVWSPGEPNQLSSETIDYPLVDRIHAATSVCVSEGEPPAAEPMPFGSGAIGLPPPAASTRSFGEVARRRRSALDFQGGMLSMSLPQLSAVLHAAYQPLHADFASARFIQLYLYIHRVDGLPAGVYRHGPQSGELELVKPGDQRVAAAGLSLGQDLAGNACVAFSMAADLERAARAFGERGYRYAFFEAGAIGQRLYLAAEALGLQATGIGAFFDDQVHRYLELAPEVGQVIYHFAIGHAVPDPRLEA